MQGINWDDVAANAELSPRVQLANALESADDMQRLVLVWQDTSGVIHIGWTWDDSEGERSSLGIIGMLETAKHNVLMEQMAERDA